MFDLQTNRCFDGTWAAAIALNCTIQQLKDKGMFYQ